MRASFRTISFLRARKSYLMKRMILALIATTALMSCNSQNHVTVNGEKVNLEEGMYALFQTTQGDILVELEYEKVPMTVGNFVALAEGSMKNNTKEEGQPFYDGTIFHRVIPDFMIQGGDPQGTGMGDPGYKFPDEFDASLRHSSKGILSMANSGPNTNGSQFFITDTATPWLDDRHSIFGQVVKGHEIVRKITKVDRDQRDKPKTDVVLEKVQIIRKGDKAMNFKAMEAFNGGQEDYLKKQAEAEAEAQRQIEAAMEGAERTESGLGYIITQKGNGEKPVTGQMVEVHYAGYLMDGTIFDTSIKEIAEKEGIYNPGREPYAPFQLQYGPQARVIEGWKEGIQLLSVGDKARLIIPPHLGYGARGAGGVIPPNATLIFDVELVRIVK